MFLKWVYYMYTHFNIFKDIYSIVYAHDGSG